MNDTELLNELTFNVDKHMKWICRLSTTDRGLRLHQSPGLGKYNSPREAIEAYFTPQTQSE